MKDSLGKEDYDKHVQAVARARLTCRLNRPLRNYEGGNVEFEMRKMEASEALGNRAFPTQTPAEARAWLVSLGLEAPAAEPSRS